MSLFPILNFFAFHILMSIALQSCSLDPLEKQQVSTTQLEGGPQSPCEGGNGGYCGNAQYFSYTKIVTLSDYPDCTFEISYRARRCGNNYDIIIESFDDSSLSDPDRCPQYQQDLQNQNPANQLSYDLFVDQMENKLARALLLALGSENIGDLEPCGSQGNPMMMNFISAHCNYYCIYIDQDQGGKRRVFTIPCGDVCCETRYEVCLLPNGQITYIQKQSTTPFGSCEPSNWPRPCPQVSIYQSPCREKCRFRFQ